MKPTEIVQKLLLNATNLDVVKELVSEDATYVSLNYNNPDLQAVRTFPRKDTVSIHQLQQHANFNPDRALVWHSLERWPRSDLSDFR